MGANIILAVGALIIFGTFLSSSNRLMMGNTQIAEQNEYYISAISLAQAVIDEAKTKAFDQKTVVDTATVALADSFTVFNKLGPEGVTENVPKPDVLVSAAPYTATSPGYKSTYKFNDIDDYDGYTRTVNTPRAEGFTIAVQVKYGDPTDPDVPLNYQTFCKRMKVTVTSPYMTDKVELSYAFTY
ncbi:MAG TPA: hypothetical protein VI215_04895 [Bacteroidota bacterium]|jgi:hypothetical protein